MLVDSIHVVVDADEFFQLEKTHKEGLLTAYIKGAPERVLAKCSTYLKDGEEVPITDAFKAEYDEAYDVSVSPNYIVHRSFYL